MNWSLCNKVIQIAIFSRRLNPCRGKNEKLEGTKLSREKELAVFVNVMITASLALHAALTKTGYYLGSTVGLLNLVAPMVASAGETSRDLAGRQFPRNCQYYRVLTL